jgi:hypothetical protein
MRPENAVARTRPEYKTAVRRASSLRVYQEDSMKKAYRLLLSGHWSSVIEVWMVQTYPGEERRLNDTKEEANGDKV